MSNMHPPQHRRRTPHPRDSFTTEREQLPELLAVLNDGDARAILEATSEEPKSAMELSECCELPSSTAYRKIDRLTELGLLKEQLAVKTTGHHVCTYELELESVHISLRNGFFDCQVNRNEE